MQVTIRQIAAHLGVSHATVSRVLNGRGEGFISAATRDLVVKTAKEMGYRPNAAARALATGRTGVVSVWIRTIETPFYAQVLHQLEELVTLDGYTLSITRQRESPRSLSDAVEVSSVDGIIAVDLLRDACEAPLYDPRRHRAVVFIGAHSPQSADYVHVDLRTGTREAVEHLLETGCRRIAYLAHEEMARSGEARFEAYRAALRDAGLISEVIRYHGACRPAARRTLVEYVRAYGFPDGILCQNDDAAIGAFRALRDLRLRIPDDVRLIGCDGIDETEYFDPSLSTIEQPIAQMCSLAWEFLRRRLADPTLPSQQVSLPAHLLIRGSSDVCLSQS
jgi:LacI family transcriptional regulator